MPEIVPLPDEDPSWPVDDRDFDHERWLPVTVLSVRTAVAVRSSHPITTAAMRATADALMEIADELEAELPAL